MGVATSSSTFFRQIGGTLGTAVLLSLLFTVMPSNIVGSLSDQDTLADALDAALDPAVATAPENAPIMETIYSPDRRPDRGATAPGRRPERRRPASPGRGSGGADDPVELEGGDGSSLGSGTLDDTSFLNGADPRLSKPFLDGLQRLGRHGVLGRPDRRADRLRADALLQGAAAAGQVGTAGGGRQPRGGRGTRRRGAADRPAGPACGRSRRIAGGAGPAHGLDSDAAPSFGASAAADPDAATPMASVRMRLGHG